MLPVLDRQLLTFPSRLSKQVFSAKIGDVIYVPTYLLAFPNFHNDT